MARWYVASLWERMPEARRVAAFLEGRGQQVTSTWHQGEVAQGAKEKMVGFDLDFSQAATRDFHEVSGCDRLLVLATRKGSFFSGGGHCTEVGIALGLGKEVVVIGEKSNIFYHLPQVMVFSTLEVAAETGVFSDE